MILAPAGDLFLFLNEAQQDKLDEQLLSFDLLVKEEGPEMDQKILIVVSLISGRNFPRRSECSLMVEAQFNKEVLTSDPIPHVGGTLPINTELAWELTRKAFQQHKLSRTPIKLQCFAVNKVTMAKENVGYVMLDLRTAHPKSQQESKWHGVLNSSYSRLKPQLLVSLSLEVEDGEGTKVKAHTKSRTKKPALTSSLSLTLDPSGDHYLLGSTGTGMQEMFILSLTLQNARNLPKIPPGQTHCYFYYCLLGNDITSELFTSPTFAAERASVKIKSDRQNLSILMASQQDMQVHLCSGSESLGRGHLSLSPLKTVDRMECTVPLGIGNASVEVIVQLECGSTPTKQHLTLQRSPQATTPSGNRGQSSSSRAKAPPGSNVVPLPSSSSVPSAKRNLAQSFDDASFLASSSSSASVRTPSSPHTSAPPHDATPTSPLTPETRTSFPVEPPDKLQMGEKLARKVADHGVSVRGVANVDSVKDRHTELHTQGVLPLSSTSGQPSATLGQLSSALGQPSATLGQPSSTPSQPPSTLGQPSSTIGHPSSSHISDYRHYRYSIDLRSLQATQLEPGTRCYLRYNYPFFGSPYPVLVQPPLTLSHGTNIFKQSFFSFDFASSHHQLHHHTSHHPLVVEVWQSCDQSHDKIMGLSQVNLSEVFSQETIIHENKLSSRKMSSLQSHIIPPTTTTTGTTSSSSSPLGQLNIVLILEDFGPLNLLGGEAAVLQNGSEIPPNISAPEDHVTKPPDHMTTLKPDSKVHVGHDHCHHRHGDHPSNGQGKPLTESTEYAVAMELEMWKMAEEEAFKEHLKTLESSHMTQLGEEWRRREGQRQHLLRQKLEHYSTLEKQLHEGLEELQTQQKSLTEKEAKLSREKEKILLELSTLRQKHEISIQSLKMQAEQQLEIERLKTSEFQHQVESLQRQVRDLEAKVRSREAEFDKYRQEMMLRPESKLQADLSIAQLEKAELERKLASFSKSKQHYKEQWSKALAELASSRHREQAAAREKLLTQQKELEAMRVQYFQQEHQMSLKQEISDVKKDMNRLQEHTFNSQPQPVTEKQPHPSSTSPSHTHQPPPPSSSPPDPHSHPHHHHNGKEGRSSRGNLSNDVARWIEERDILLQTGVYSSTDPTIQKLDSKIREVMGEIKNSEGRDEIR